MNCNRRSVRWIFDCNKWYPTRQEWVTASTSIQTEEKDRIGRFFFKRDAKNSMAGRLLMRKFLTQYSGLRWKDIEILRSERGKPYFKNKTLNFNVSHQGGYAILAAEVGDFNVGCDVMTVEYRKDEKLRDYLKIMTKQLSTDEYKMLTNPAKSEHDVCRLFCRLWCLKESYVKALGTGINLHMGELSFDIKDEHLTENKFVTSTTITVKGELQQNWSFHEILVDKNTFAAVALSPKCDPLVDEFQRLSIEDLLNEAEQIIPFDQEYCDNFFKKENAP